MNLLTERLCEIDRISKQIQEAKILLCQVEWLYDTGAKTYRCPICLCLKDGGHSEDCKLNEFLNENEV